MGVSADQQLGRVDAAVVQPAQLGEQYRRVHNDAVADYRSTSGREDSGREEMQRILLVTHDNRVAGVVAALVTHYIIH